MLFDKLYPDKPSISTCAILKENFKDPSLRKKIINWYSYEKVDMHCTKTMTNVWKWLLINHKATIHLRTSLYDRRAQGEKRREVLWFVGEFLKGKLLSLVPMCIQLQIQTLYKSKPIFELRSISFRKREDTILASRRNTTCVAQSWPLASHC